jgi:hypothetical protein
VLLHYYTNDNSEVVFVSAHRNWEDIEKADAKNNELAKAAWPDEAARRAFFAKENSYYTSEHADKIRQILPNTKPLGSTATPMVYYVRTRHREFPKDGKAAELEELMNEYNQNVTLKNSLIKGYYPLRHMWGANSLEYIEAFVFNSLEDMEASQKESDTLVKAHWPEEAQRKAFFDKLNKYFVAWHGDAIYRHVPELRKLTAAAK